MIVRYLLVLIFSVANGVYLHFDRNSYDLLVSESTQIYSTVGLIEASASAYLPIEYELHGETNGTFHLNSTTGALTLWESLDYESIPVYKFTVEARSSSFLPPCFAELVVHVLNVNDHTPEIDLIGYASSNVIIYDLQRSSTPFATLHLRDRDESTKNLSVHLNDSEHFHVELLRQVKGSLLSESLYILSTKNNGQFVDHQYSYGLLIHACDHDQPNLCSTRSSRWQLQSKVSRCYLSFHPSSTIIDIDEDLPIRTLIFPKATNLSCEKISFALDDSRDFFVDSQTGELYTSRHFNRTEQSLYRVHLLLDHAMRIPLTIRILDQIGRRPFLTRKHLRLSPQRFEQIHLYNTSVCRAETMVETYFQILSNCTIRALVVPPPIGRFRFTIDLKERVDYQDTFVLELREERSRTWMIVLCSSSAILLAMFSIVIIYRRHRTTRKNSAEHRQYHPASFHPSLSFSSRLLESTRSRLQVYDDDNQPAVSPIKDNRADDEGYSGSSNVSDRALALDSSIATLYDIPRLQLCTDISLV